LNAAGGNATTTAGQILINIDPVLESLNPDAFLVLGDTNSCLCAIAAKKRKIPIFHINHDYKLGSKIYPHIHWCPMSYSTGNVKWTIEYVVAKGHNQNESLIGVTTSFSLIAAGKGLIGEHMVTECSEEQAFVVDEPDTLVRLRVYRDSTNAQDTFYGSVMGLMVDFHFQSDRETTPQKSPDFYIED
jgi:hypothetical protein